MKYEDAINYLKKRVCIECQHNSSPVDCSHEKCGYKQSINKAVDAMEYMILLGLDKECEACKVR